LWQLFDIAYVIPASVFIGYWIGKFLEARYEGDFFVNSVLIAAGLGLVLTIIKIKRFIDQQNNRPLAEPQLESN
jgi:hypothetical protein